MTYLEKYNLWLNTEHIDSETKKELSELNDDKEIEDRFYKDLEFGTGGLRGIIGAGTNRMNVYTVKKATQGLANYLNNKYCYDNKYKDNISVSIAYDSRIMSKEFAIATAETLCANNIKVNLYKELTPTPMLSYAVRELKSKAGIVITASHNPKQYNGYKVYGQDGGQVTDTDAKEIIGYVNRIEEFYEIKTMDFELAKKQGLINIIYEDMYKSYIDKVKGLSIRKELIKNNAKDLKIIYTPIHGSGNIPVRRVLNELGFENTFVVKEQEIPNGEFPTAPYPNPEDPKVFSLALNMAKDIEPDIIFGTDPDCDRIGVVIKDNNGEYKVLSGNQTGILLSNYILEALNENNNLHKDSVIIKTIVTTEMIKCIAANYKVEVMDVLTGFKYIGEKIREFEELGNKQYIFGFEESFGYLAGDFVRDKDAVISAMLISEMTLYYKNRGMTLYEALIELYEKYGFYNESLISIELSGKEGQEKIANSLEYLRHSMKAYVGEVKIVKKLDYKLGIEKDILNIEEYTINLPKSNVLKFILEDGSWFVIRPSGTEPKMKIYLSVVGKSLKDSEEKLGKLKENIMFIVNKSFQC